MIISTATKSLRKRCNTDTKEKFACEIYELITCSCLPLIETSPLKPVHSNQQIGFYMIGISMMKDLKKPVNFFYFKKKFSFELLKITHLKNDKYGLDCGLLQGDFLNNGKP